MKKIQFFLIFIFITHYISAQNCKTRKIESDPLSEYETTTVGPNTLNDYLREDSTKVVNRVLDITFKSKKYKDSTFFFLVFNYKYHRSTDYYYATDHEMTVELFFSDDYYIRTAPTRQFFDSKVTDIMKNSITFECRVFRKDIIHFTQNSRFLVKFNIKEKKKNKSEQTVQTFKFVNNLAGDKISERAKCLLQ